MAAETDEVEQTMRDAQEWAKATGAQSLALLERQVEVQERIAKALERIAAVVEEKEA